MTLPLPSDSRVIGIDWSGGKDAPRKVWAAVLDLTAGRRRVGRVWRPFTDASGARDVAFGLARWLRQQEFDVAGLDFCFGLNRDHHTLLGLSTEGPSHVGRDVRRRFGNPDDFKLAVGAERKRLTDVTAESPFAPTNLRMYRQTYWGLVALAEVEDSIPPWSSSGRCVVEVLPAHVARRLGAVGYKNRAGREARARLVADIERLGQLEIETRDADALRADDDGDAVDALLAALGAGGGLAARFDAPREVAETGEGWIYSLP